VPFFVLRALPGGGSPSASRCAARGAAQEPAGVTLGATSAATRFGRAAQKRPFIYCPSGRVGLRLGVSESASCLRGNGRPSRSAPYGPYPVEALAYATGPEGDTRRLFRILRFVGPSAPLAIGEATVLSQATRAASSLLQGQGDGSLPPTRTRLTLLLSGATTAPDGNNHGINSQGKAATDNNKMRKAKSDQQAAASA
jgi:hypothetical protein